MKITPKLDNKQVGEGGEEAEEEEKKKNLLSHTQTLEIC